ncbi:MAG: ankyrin repeat domain-containing protein, partial [Chloroflexi bacterium]|nr:ankyrin repeat domain-containing protein [Chloroflexota bacterium]
MFTIGVVLRRSTLLVFTVFVLTACGSDTKPTATPEVAAHIATAVTRTQTLPAATASPQPMQLQPATSVPPPEPTATLEPTKTPTAAVTPALSPTKAPTLTPEPTLTPTPEPTPYVIHGYCGRLCDEAFWVSAATIESVQDELDEGADPGAKDEFGQTPLHWASKLNTLVFNSDTTAIELLLDHGADIDAKNSHGWTPLVEIADTDNTAAINFLLERGADVNAKDNRNST